MEPTPNIELMVAQIRAGLTNVEVGARAYMHPTRYSAIKRGRIVPNRSERRRIAKVFRVAPETFWPQHVPEPESVR